MDFTNREKELLLSNAPVLSRIHLYDQDGSLLQVFNENDYLVDWDYEDFRYVPNQGFIGQFVERLLDGHLMNVPENISLENKEISVEIAVVDPLLQTQVYHNYGRFIITKIEQEDTTGSYKFESSDYTKKFNVAFKGDEVTYPCTALELLNHACEQAGVKLNSGKNLFDYENISNYVNSGNSNLTKITNGIRIATTTQGTNRFASVILGEYSNFSGKTISVSGTITPSSTNNAMWQLWYMNSSKGLISQIDNPVNTNFTKTLTSSPPTDTYYLALVLYNTRSVTSVAGMTTDFTNVQIEEGSTATTYEAYPQYSISYAVSEDNLEAGNYYFKDEDNYYNFTLSENLKLFDSLMLIGDKIIQRTITDDYKVVETNIYYTTSNSGTGTELEGSKVPYIDFTNNNFVIENNQFEEQDSCRNVVTSIAKLSYTLARINEDNVLKLDFSKKVEEDVDSYGEIDTDKYYEATVTGNTFGPVNKVVVGMSNVDGENIVNDFAADKITLDNMNGDTSQNTYQGYQLLKKKAYSTPTTDTDYWQENNYGTPLEDGWISLNIPDTNTDIYINVYTKIASIDYEDNTDYTIIFEWKDKSANIARVNLSQSSSNTNPFSNNVGLALGTSGTYKALVTTKNPIPTTSYGLRLFLITTASTARSIKMRVMIVKGDYTNQDIPFEYYVGGVPSPNPDYPQNIKCVEGENQVYVNSENLFIPTLTNNGTKITVANGTVVLNDDEYTLTATDSDMYFGQITSTGQNYYNNKGVLYSVGSATKIYFKCTNSTFNKNFITFYDENKVSLVYYKHTSSSGSRTVPADAKYFTFRFGYDSAVSGTEYKTKVMVSYEPITDYIPNKSQIYNINLGKNLWNEDYIGINTNVIYKPIYVGNGVFTASTTTPRNTSNNANLFFLTGNVTSGASTANNGLYTNHPITINSTNGYVTIAYRNGSNVDPRDYQTQIEKNNSVTSYTPYIDVPVDIGENLFNCTYETHFYSNNLPTSETTQITINSSSPTSVNATWTGNSYTMVLTNTLQLNPYTTYTLSFDRIYNGSRTPRTFLYSLTGNTYELLNNNSGASVESYTGNNVFITFTTTSTGLVAFGFGFNSNSNGAVLDVKNIRLEKGPNMHKDIHSIELNDIAGSKDLLFNTTGKNLVNKNLIVQNTRNNISQLNTGVKVTCIQDGAYRWSMIPISTGRELLGKTVTFSANLKYSGTNDAQMVLYFVNNLSSSATAVTVIGSGTQTTESSISKTVTIPSEYPSGTTAIALLLYSSCSSTTVGEWIEYTNLQLELGDTTTSYEPFGKGDWYWYRKNRKVILDGNEKWYSSTSARPAFSNYMFTDKLDGQGNFKSDKFSYRGGSAQKITYGYAMSFNTGQYYNYIYVQVPDTIVAIADADAFRTWLNNNITEVKYPLNEPEYLKVTYQPLIDQLNIINENAHTYDGKTYITSRGVEINAPIDITTTDIDGVETSYTGTDIEATGTHEYKDSAINIYDNPLTHSEALRRIAINGSEKLFGIRYTPMEVNSIGHPWLNGNEFMKVTNLEEQDLYFYPFDRKMTYKGYLETTLSAQSKNEVAQKYENKNTLLDRMHHTEIDVDKANGQISLISNQTDVNTSDISNITINVNSITNSVESIQNTTIPTINSNIDNISGDIDTINNQINTIQNTELTNIVSRLSQVEQTAESITNMFQISGGINIIRNSAFLLSDNLWEFTNNGTNPYYTPLGSSYNSTLSGTTASVAEIKLRSIKVKSKSENITNLKIGTKYTFNFYHQQDNNMTTTIKMYSTENNSSKAFNDIVITGQQAFKNYEVSFTPTTYSNYTLEIIVTSTASVGYSYLYDMMLNAGDKQSWQPASDEIYSTTLTMSRLGLQVYSVGDGTITLLGSEGLLSYETSDGRTRGRLVSKRTVDGDLVVSTTAQNLYLAQDITQVAEHPTTTPKWVTTVSMINGRLSEVKYLESGGQ